VPAWLLTCLIGGLVPLLIGFVWPFSIMKPAGIIFFSLVFQYYCASLAWGALNARLRRRSFVFGEHTA